MKRRCLSLTGCILLTTLILSIHGVELIAQSSEERILTNREASNAALKALDEEANLQFLTDDVLITTGNGTLLSGKDKLMAYIESAADSPPIYWVRTPAEIIVNEERGLAWETGVWHAYSADDTNEESPVSHGNYAAQWIHQSGEWKIQSQLFVTLN
jgi:ketosteroid isomerase-like protein